MTDQLRWESWVTVSVNGQKAGSYWLEDDPADHRGILSWHAQPHDNYLREAGSYGYLIEATLPLDALKEGEPIVLRLAVPDGITGEWHSTARISGAIRSIRRWFYQEDAPGRQLTATAFFRHGDTSCGQIDENGKKRSVCSPFFLTFGAFNSKIHNPHRQ